MSYVAIGKEEGRILAGGEGDDSKGWFINQQSLLTLQKMLA